MDYDVNDDDAPQPQAGIIPVVGGIFVLMNYLRDLVIHGVHGPFEEFKRQITCNKEATRI